MTRKAPKTKSRAWYLLIDSSRRDHLTLKLFSAADVKIFSGSIKTHSIIEILDTFLKLKLALARIRGIAVVHGPGSFSALRSGMIISQLMARYYDIPIMGVSADAASDLRGLIKRFQKLKSDAPRRMLKPQYGKLPNITVPHHA